MNCNTKTAPLVLVKDLNPRGTQSTETKPSRRPVKLPDCYFWSVIDHSSRIKHLCKKTCENGASSACCGGVWCRRWRWRQSRLLFKLIGIGASPRSIRHCIQHLVRALAVRWLVWLPHWEIVISMPQDFSAHLNEIITRLSVFRKMQAEKRLKMLFARLPRNTIQMQIGTILLLEENFKR